MNKQEVKGVCGICGGKVAGIFTKKCQTCGTKRNDVYISCKYCGKTQHKDNEYCIFDGAKGWQPKTENSIRSNDAVMNENVADIPISSESNDADSFNSFEEAFNSYQFYFGVLPFIWESPERRSMTFTLFDTKGGKECMGIFLHAMNLMLFPEQQNNPMLKVLGMKLIDDFNNENYSKLFAFERINIGSGHHILEVDFPDYKNQKELVKVEKVYLVSSKDHSKGRVITLESNLVTEDQCLCEVFSNGNRSNFGPVNYDNVHKELRRIL